MSGGFSGTPGLPDVLVYVLATQPVRVDTAQFPDRCASAVILGQPLEALDVDADGLATLVARDLSSLRAPDVAAIRASYFSDSLRWPWGLKHDDSLNLK